MVHLCRVVYSLNRVSIVGGQDHPALEVYDSVEKTEDGQTVTAIRGLEIGDLVYDVEFPRQTGAKTYDAIPRFPTTFDFESETDLFQPISAGLRLHVILLYFLHFHVFFVSPNRSRIHTIAKLKALKKALNVEPFHIREILFEIINRGSPVASNRVRSYLHAAFTYGIYIRHPPR